LNISEVIQDIKEPCGLETIALPFDKPTEVVLAEIIKTSVHTFSQFKPWIRESDAAIKDLQSPSEFARKQGIYILPPDLTRTHVSWADAYLTTAQLDGGQAVAANSFTVGSPFVGFGSYYPQDILNATMTGAAINKYAGVTSRPQTSEWLGFNKIKLYDHPDDGFVHFIAKCDHDPSLETIPESCRESFIQLATLDVQRTLYNKLKNMIHTGGAFKDSQLDISSWSGAEEERKALVKEWTGTFHFDDIDLITFF